MYFDCGGNYDCGNVFRNIALISKYSNIGCPKNRTYKIFNGSNKGPTNLIIFFGLILQSVYDYSPKF